MASMTDEWPGRSTCSSGSELAGTFSQAVPLLQLGCARVSAGSKAEGSKVGRATSRFHSPVLGSAAPGVQPPLLDHTDF